METFTVGLVLIWKLLEERPFCVGQGMLRILVHISSCSICLAAFLCVGGLSLETASRSLCSRISWSSLKKSSPLVVKPFSFWGWGSTQMRAWTCDDQSAAKAFIIFCRCALQATWHLHSYAHTQTHTHAHTHTYMLIWVCIIVSVL